MFRILAKFPVRADQVESFRAIASELVAQSQEEPGILSYSLNVSTEDPLLFSFFEVYEDAAAHTAHEHTDHCATLFPKMQALMSGEPVIECFEEV